MKPILLLLLLCFPLLLLKILAKHNGDGRKNLPPGPWSLPIIGNLHQVGPMPHRSFLSLAQKHGPIMFLRLGSIPALVVSSGEALKTIFKSHDLNFSGRPVFQAVKKLSFNNSNISFAAYGENWRRARKLCVTELLSSRRVRSFQSVREEEVAMLSAAINKLSSSTSSPINLSEMVFALSYNVMCRTVFGDQHGGGAGVYHGQRNWFREVMAETQAIVAEFCAADFFPGWDWIDLITGQRARLEKNFEVVNGIYERVIEEHRRRGKEEDDGDRREEDLVDVLLRSHGEAGDGGFPDTINYVKGIMAGLFRVILRLRATNPPPMAPPGSLLSSTTTNSIIFNQLSATWLCNCLCRARNHDASPTTALHQKMRVKKYIRDVYFGAPLTDYMMITLKYKGKEIYHNQKMMFTLEPHICIRMYRLY